MIESKDYLMKARQVIRTCKVRVLAKASRLMSMARHLSISTIKLPCLVRKDLRTTLLIWMVNGSVLTVAYFQTHHALDAVRDTSIDHQKPMQIDKSLTPEQWVYSLIIPSEKHDLDISSLSVCAESEQYSFVHVVDDQYYEFSTDDTELSMLSDRADDAESAVRHRLVEFAIHGNFTDSVKKAGLSAHEVRALERIAGWRFNLASLKTGDHISMLVRDVVDDKSVDINRLISALNISYNGQHLSIIGYRDEKGGWSYYTSAGQPYRENVFSRIPLKRDYRISSSFAPNRMHPITRRATPHRGTDFATPIGTEVVIPADGVVVRGGRNHLNGNYIMIDHPGGYRTVYLHLHRIHPQLKIGMRVRKGDVVAQTGNTGRSTRPHLHYEIHDRGTPVDPMRVRLPNDYPLAEADVAYFRLHAQQMIASLVSREEGESLARWP